ncbi:hypothetical protein [Pseudonocardia sp. N23]|uniref:hypothetical protein n=1 Tax=Pseudonocardia sp. N23 TaxID=1987376 RepID=UPI000BFE073F|nr:hypothetical protein [Pseudonocardia sp. N23]GAY12373.1 hypothetical protein TOK_0768 [Pseudonocardia sp. N23]
MSEKRAENAVADRLLSEARKRTAHQQKAPTGRGKIAMIVGIVALVASPISIAGWVFGLVTLGMGISAVRRPDQAKLAKIAIALGAAAIFVGTFFYTLSISMR